MSAKPSIQQQRPTSPTATQRIDSSQLAHEARHDTNSKLGESLERDALRPKEESSRFLLFVRTVPDVFVHCVTPFLPAKTVTSLSSTCVTLRNCIRVSDEEIWHPRCFCLWAAPHAVPSLKPKRKANALPPYAAMARRSDRFEILRIERIRAARIEAKANGLTFREGPETIGVGLIDDEDEAVNGNESNHQTTSGTDPASVLVTDHLNAAIIDAGQFFAFSSSTTTSAPRSQASTDIGSSATRLLLAPLFTNQSEDNGGVDANEDDAAAAAAACSSFAKHHAVEAQRIERYHQIIKRGEIILSWKEDENEIALLTPSVSSSDTETAEEEEDEVAPAHQLVPQHVRIIGSVPFIRFMRDYGDSCMDELRQRLFSAGNNAKEMLDQIEYIQSPLPALVGDDDNHTNKNNTAAVSSSTAKDGALAAQLLPTSLVEYGGEAHSYNSTNTAAYHTDPVMEMNNLLSPPELISPSSAAAATDGGLFMSGGGADGSGTCTLPLTKKALRKFAAINKSSLTLVQREEASRNLIATKQRQLEASSRKQHNGGGGGGGGTKATKGGAAGEIIATSRRRNATSNTNKPMTHISILDSHAKGGVSSSNNNPKPAGPSSSSQQYPNQHSAGKSTQQRSHDAIDLLVVDPHTTPTGSLAANIPLLQHHHQAAGGGGEDDGRDPNGAGAGGVGGVGAADVDEEHHNENWFLEEADRESACQSDITLWSTSNGSLEREFNHEYQHLLVKEQRQQQELEEIMQKLKEAKQKKHSSKRKKRRQQQRRDLESHGDGRGGGLSGGPLDGDGPLDPMASLLAGGDGDHDDHHDDDDYHDDEYDDADDDDHHPAAAAAPQAATVPQPTSFPLTLNTPHASLNLLNPSPRLLAATNSPQPFSSQRPPSPTLRWSDLSAKTQRIVAQEYGMAGDVAAGGGGVVGGGQQGGMGRRHKSHRSSRSGHSNRSVVSLQSLATSNKSLAPEEAKAARAMLGEHVPSHMDGGVSNHAGAMMRSTSASALNSPYMMPRAAGGGGGGGGGAGVSKGESRGDKADAMPPLSLDDEFSLPPAATATATASSSAEALVTKDSQGREERHSRTTSVGGRSSSDGNTNAAPSGGGSEPQLREQFGDDSEMYVLENRPLLATAEDNAAKKHKKRRKGGASSRASSSRRSATTATSAANELLLLDEEDGTSSVAPTTAGATSEKGSTVTPKRLGGKGRRNGSQRSGSNRKASVSSSSHRMKKKVRDLNETDASRTEEQSSSGDEDDDAESSSSSDTSSSCEDETATRVTQSVVESSDEEDDEESSEDDDSDDEESSSSYESGEEESSEDESEYGADLFTTGGGFKEGGASPSTAHQRNLIPGPLSLASPSNEQNAVLMTTPNPNKQGGGYDSDDTLDDEDISVEQQERLKAFYNTVIKMVTGRGGNQNNKDPSSATPAVEGGACNDNNNNGEGGSEGVWVAQRSALKVASTTPTIDAHATVWATLNHACNAALSVTAPPPPPTAATTTALDAAHEGGGVEKEKGTMNVLPSPAADGSAELLAQPPHLITVAPSQGIGESPPQQQQQHNHHHPSTTRTPIPKGEGADHKSNNSRHQQRRRVTISQECVERHEARHLQQLQRRAAAMVTAMDSDGFVPRVVLQAVDSATTGGLTSSNLANSGGGGGAEGVDATHGNKHHHRHHHHHDHSGSHGTSHTTAHSSTVTNSFTSDLSLLGEESGSGGGGSHHDGISHASLATSHNNLLVQSTYSSPHSHTAPSSSVVATVVEVLLENPHLLADSSGAAVEGRRGLITPHHKEGESLHATASASGVTTTGEDHTTSGGGGLMLSEHSHPPHHRATPHAHHPSTPAHRPLAAPGGHSSGGGGGGGASAASRKPPPPTTTSSQIPAPSAAFFEWLSNATAALPVSTLLGAVDRGLREREGGMQQHRSNSGAMLNGPSGSGSFNLWSDNARGTPQHAKATAVSQTRLNATDRDLAPPASSGLLGVVASRSPSHRPTALVAPPPLGVGISSSTRHKDPLAPIVAAHVLRSNSGGAGKLVMPEGGGEGGSGGAINATANKLQSAEVAPQSQHSIFSPTYPPPRVLFLPSPAPTQASPLGEASTSPPPSSPFLAGEEGRAGSSNVKNAAIVKSPLTPKTSPHETAVTLPSPPQPPGSPSVGDDPLPPQYATGEVVGVSGGGLLEEDDNDNEWYLPFSQRSMRNMAAQAGPWKHAFISCLKEASQAELSKEEILQINWEMTILAPNQLPQILRTRIPATAPSITDPSPPSPAAGATSASALPPPPHLRNIPISFDTDGLARSELFPAMHYQVVHGGKEVAVGPLQRLPVYKGLINSAVLRGPPPPERPAPRPLGSSSAGVGIFANLVQRRNEQQRQANGSANTTSASAATTTATMGSGSSNNPPPPAAAAPSRSLFSGLVGRAAATNGSLQPNGNATAPTTGAAASSSSPSLPTSIPRLTLSSHMPLWSINLLEAASHRSQTLKKRQQAEGQGEQNGKKKEDGAEKKSSDSLSAPSPLPSPSSFEFIDRWRWTIGNSTLAIVSVDIPRPEYVNLLAQNEGTM